MIDDARMFNTINTNGNDGYDSIIFDENGKDKVKGLGKIVISNDLSIFNVLLVESFVDEIWSAVHRGGCPWW